MTRRQTRDAMLGGSLYVIDEQDMYSEALFVEWTGPGRRYSKSAARDRRVTRWVAEIGRGNNFVKEFPDTPETRLVDVTFELIARHDFKR